MTYDHNNGNQPTIHVTVTRRRRGLWGRIMGWLNRDRYEFTPAQFRAWIKCGMPEGPMSEWTETET